MAGDTRRIVWRLPIGRTRLSNSTRSISISCIDPITDPAWCALLKHPSAGLFHSPPWLRAIRDAYGFAIRAYLARDVNDGPVGGLAVCEIDDAAGHRLVTVPFSDSCDPLFTSDEVWRALFRELQSHQLPVNLRCLNEHRISTEDGLTTVKRARWHRLSVLSPAEELLLRMTPECRRAIRRANKVGLEVRPLVGDEDRVAFHQLHANLRKQKYRMLAQPLCFFEAIERRFRQIDGWHSLGAFLGDRMIAATVYVRWGDTLYYKFNASASDALNTRPNNLLVWSGVMLAQSLGCRFLDLGPSDDDQPGLIRFKRNFGAQEHELRFLRWTPPGWREAITNRTRLGEITRRLTEPHIPYEVAARAGAALYRYFA
jgi:CelD/BcsL family acetyltransferase involved in cellulose biosynthesis